MTTIEVKIKLGKETLLMDLCCPFGSGWNLAKKDGVVLMEGLYNGDNKIVVMDSHPSTELIYTQLRDIVKKNIKQVTNN